MLGMVLTNGVAPNRPKRRVSASAARRQPLVAEEDHAMLDQRPTDGGEAGVVKRFGEVDPADLGTSAPPIGRTSRLSLPSGAPLRPEVENRGGARSNTAICRISPLR